MIIALVALLLFVGWLVYYFMTMKKKTEKFYETAPRLEGYNDWEYENESSAYVPH